MSNKGLIRQLHAFHSQSLPNLWKGSEYVLNTVPDIGSIKSCVATATSYISSRLFSQCGEYVPEMIWTGGTQSWPKMIIIMLQVPTGQSTDGIHAPERHHKMTPQALSSNCSSDLLLPPIWSTDREDVSLGSKHTILHASSGSYNFSSHLSRLICSRLFSNKTARTPLLQASTQYCVSRLEAVNFHPIYQIGRNRLDGISITSKYTILHASSGRRLFIPSLRPVCSRLICPVWSTSIQLTPVQCTSI